MDPGEVGEIVAVMVTVWLTLTGPVGDDVTFV
jgi:hypothetical protein